MICEKLQTANGQAEDWRNGELGSGYRKVEIITAYEDNKGFAEIFKAFAGAVSSILVSDLKYAFIA